MAQNPKNSKNVAPQENEVDVAMSKTEQFFTDKGNQKWVMYGALAIVLVVAAIFGFIKMGEVNTEKAQQNIWEAEQLFSQGEYAQALEGFEEVIDEYGSTPTGNTAKAYAGLCQKNLGNYAEAISLLKDFSGKDNVMAPAILSALGDCYVDQETPEYTKAAETFIKAAKAADNAMFTPLFLKKAGLAYEAAEDNASALKAYQNIKDNWAETSIAASIDKYIERVK